jgi:parvulin-like peptidyl-prolyl isomerase
MDSDDITSTPTGVTEGTAPRRPPALWFAGIALLVVAALVAASIALARGKTTSAAATSTPAVPALAATPSAPTLKVAGGPVAAIVNGKPVSTADFRQFLKINEQQALTQQAQTGQQIPLSSIAQQTMDEVISQAIILQFAAAHHIGASQAEINSELATIYQRNGGKAAIVKRISQVGLNLNSYLKLFVGPSIISHKVEQVVAPLPKSPIAGKVQTSAHVRHLLIMLAPQGKPPRTDAQAHALAKQLLARIQRGASFVALVKKYTDDTASANTGGVYDVTPSSGMVAPFEHAALTFPLHTPTIIKSQFGYHIIEVLARGKKPGPATSPQQAQTNAIQAWLAKQVKAAKVKRIAKVTG